MDVTARSKELLRDIHMPLKGRGVEGREAIVCLKIDVTARGKELLRDGCMT
jgi:hypothetical protein